MTAHIIIGNFGNHSLAVMQALIESAVSQLHFIHIDTGWATALWSERVSACVEYAHKQGVEVHLLHAQASFSEMVLQRKQFPSRKFQWCASFLKGLTIINHLDELDPACEAIIISGKRRFDSRRYKGLEEFEPDNEYYQGRTLWYPLWQTDNQAFEQLIKNTGFAILPHQSLECSPCIHTNPGQLPAMELQDVERLESLEQQLQQTMFYQPIRSLYESANISKKQDNLSPDLQQFDLGCGAPWGCGE